ncbi:MAG: hypothetical protein WC967_06065 [Balneolaceae bacterium]
MHIKPTLFAAILLGLLFGSCKEPISGNRNENQAPSTNLTVESINREGGFRLSSQIRISWFGTDPDGYVIGYEYAINDTSEGAWTFTTKTDSTFILPITPGQSQDDVLFKVRAIDNDNLRDPIGARLVYPILNSRPTVAINRTQSPPDTLFSIASFGWSFNDPDGLLNIARTEVAVNDTVNGWVEIPFTESDEGELFISLEVDNTSSGEKEAQVFLGRSYSTLQVDGNNVVIPGVKVGDENIFYVRAVDAAEEVSKVDTLSWFVKKQGSKTLFLNDFTGTNTSAALDLHLSILQENGITPDIWNINDGEVVQGRVALSKAFPTVLDPTLKKTLAKWDHIYWISDDLDRNIVYAQEILSEFYKSGGTSFVNIPIKTKDLGEELFNYLPVDSIGSGNFIISKDSLITPAVPLQAELKSTSSRVDVLPIKGISGSQTLYVGNYKKRNFRGQIQPYDGYKGVAIENPEGNLVYFAIDMRYLNGNNNLGQFIQELVVGRLGFKQ